MKLIIPYIFENGSPKEFSLFSRDLKNDRWIFPLGQIVFFRLIENKFLLANSSFEFIFISFSTKLIQMSVHLEFEESEKAFDVVRNEPFDIQCTAAKAFYVL